MIDVRKRQTSEEIIDRRRYATVKRYAIVKISEKTRVRFASGVRHPQLIVCPPRFIVASDGQPLAGLMCKQMQIARRSR